MIRLLSLPAVASLFLMLAAAAAPLLAQAYPSRTVRIIVTFPAGGSSDTLTRVIANEMTETLGQPVVIENRTGAGGNIGLDAAAKAAPDGYTILSSSSSLPLSNVLFSKLNFNAMTDFAPITLIGSSPMLVVVNPQFPAKTVPELIAIAKQKPGEIAYASAGYGSMNHLAVEMLKVQAGIDMRHVPYRGNPIAVVDVISGQVPVFFDYLLTGMPHVKDGKVRALATTGAKRTPALPNLPTMAEAGVPNFEASVWFAFFAPAATPPDIIDKLNKATLAALAKPSVRDRLNTLGVEVDPKGPEELKRLMQSDHAKWSELVPRAGIKKID